MLDKQCKILSVDTGNFYSNRERRLHILNHKLRQERKYLKTRLELIETSVEKKGYHEKEFKLMVNGKSDVPDDIFDLVSDYRFYSNLIVHKRESIKQSKDKLLSLLENKTKQNILTNGKDHIRTLNESTIKTISGEFCNKNVISVFDSFCTRTIGMKQDEFSDAFMVVQIYYYDLIKDMIHFGFMYHGEKYVYFTSSAGQIRTKKCVFMKESIWKEKERPLMCGLTLDKINEKGGINPNKFLAYTALSNSATDEWIGFDIDRVIVVDDFETQVYGEFDYISDEDYSITRKHDRIPIPHTDGCGIMLPEMGCTRMVRLPWIKGLLGVFDFVSFIQEFNCSPVVKDIYGIEHDVIAEKIQVIMTKSQFKLYKYYDSWEDYKQKFKKYGCHACYTKPEEERIKDSKINYQMLQSLSDITDDEIVEIASDSIKKLNSLCTSVDTIKAALGITAYNQNQTYLQKSIALYPNLINDDFIKSKIREIKDSMVKRYKAGKLEVKGKYTFVLPDLFAFCQWLFQRIEVPEGLLKDGEVFCWLFRKDKELDCLRSPHLFFEHAIRKNKAYIECQDRDKIRKWFCTNSLYTSTHDLITKILQLDVDGDTLLVVSDKKIIEIAKRNKEKYDFVPLYYDMRKADASEITNEVLYNGLNAAFTYGNIGVYSNNISKIWNCGVFQYGTEEEKKIALDTIRLLCAESNFSIDAAKTLYMPERTDDFGEQVKMYTKNKLPHFFVYAKDKLESQVEAANKSLVNQLDKIIPNPRINCRGLKIGKINYAYMMSNPELKIEIEVNGNGKPIADRTDSIILIYLDMSRKYRYKISNVDDNVFSASSSVNLDSNLKNDIVIGDIAKEIRQEFFKTGKTEKEITDILVKYLYDFKKSKNKEVLWFCFGKQIYRNLLRNKSLILKDIRQYGLSFEKSIQCEECGTWFFVKKNDNTTTKCRKCYAEYRRKYKTEKQSEYRSITPT